MKYQVYAKWSYRRAYRPNRIAWGILSTDNLYLPNAKAFWVICVGPDEDSTVRAALSVRAALFEFRSWTSNFWPKTADFQDQLSGKIRELQQKYHLDPCGMYRRRTHEEDQRT